MSDQLDPSTPIEDVDAELRAAGIDPAAVGERGSMLAKVLLENRRLREENSALRECADAIRRHEDHVCAQRAELISENERLSGEYQRVDAELGVFKTTAQALNGRINELESQATRLRGSRDEFKAQLRTNSETFDPQAVRGLLVEITDAAREGRLNCASVHKLAKRVWDSERK